MTAARHESRIAQLVDAEEVADLLDRFQREFDEYTPGAAVLADRVRRHIAEDLSVFVLAGSSNVGVTQLRFREYMITGTPVCLLEELYVVGHRRREGHGRRLVETSFQLARARGATTMELGTAFSDGAARALYEGLGFTNLERPGRPETQMLFYEREL